MDPLSRQEFQSALKKGQGRALRHVMTFGLAEYKDLVLEACLHNQNYDARIDTCRAPWLFSMFKDTVFYDEFREAIFSHMETTPSWDIVQLSDLLREMAEAGDSLAREKLKLIVYKDAAESSEYEHILIEKFINLQTTDEFLQLAQILGNRLINDDQAFPFDGLIPKKEKITFKEMLWISAQNDPAAHRFWQYLDERGKFDDTPRVIDRDAARRYSHDRVRKEYSLDQTIKDARKKKEKFPGRYATFGRHATKEELDAIYAILISEEDPEIQKRLLWVFRSSQLPKLDDVLFKFANGDNGELKEAAIYALAQVADEKVHQLAKEKVARLELLGPDSDSFHLFERNYEKSDAKSITSALGLIEPNEDDCHDLGYRVVMIAEAQEDPGLSDALRWVYENTPCMNCRYRAVVQLKRFNTLNEEIIQELGFDADDSIRDLALK
jgi:hypothetical protein